MTAENNVFLDQLTFGEKIESPDALAIPVTLAVALLKNRRGEIDLHLPVSGSINDPQFRIGRCHCQRFRQSALEGCNRAFCVARLAFGGGEELSEVSFSARAGGH